MNSFRSRFTFTNLGAFISFVIVAGVASYVTFSSKLVVTGANAILSQPCDQLQYQQLAAGTSSAALGVLYPRTVTSLSSIYPGLSRDLAIAAALLVALTLVGGFIVTLTLLKDAWAGLLASVVTVFLVSATGVLQLSEYAFLEGLAFTLLTAAFLFRYSETGKFWLLPPAALLGLLAALSDPYWGVILFVAATGTTLLSVAAKAPMSKASLPAVSTTPTLAVSIYSLALYRPTPATLFQWDAVLVSILVLAALWGGASLVLKRRRSPIILLVPLIVASLIVTPFSSLQYAIIPLALLAVMSLSSVGAGVISVQRRPALEVNGTHGREVFDVDIDLAKLLSVVVVIVLVLSSGFLGSFAFAGGLQMQRVESNTYGASQINTALDWIRTNTSMSSVIAAPEAFSNWVQTFTGRQTLLGPPACPSPSNSDSPQAQANDLLLNSNVELRNEYLKLTDGSPYWTTQTPMFSVSNGSAFADLIQTTDAYNRIGFSYAGSNWIEAPYNPENFSLGWVARNSTEASLRMTFTTDALRIEKTMTLSEGSREADLAYAVSPMNGVQLHSMNVTFWIPYNETVGNLTRSGGAFRLPVNNQPVLISPNPLPTNATLGLVGGQYSLVLEYKISAETFSVSLLLSFPSAVKSSWSAGVQGITSDEIIREYGVTYLLVPNQPAFSSRLDADSRFRLVYSSANILVFAFRAA